MNPSSNEGHDFFSNIPSREVWETGMSENAYLYRDLDKEIVRIHGEDDNVDYWGKYCSEFIKEAANAGLKKEDLRQFGAFHLMVGSSTTYEKHMLFDLPGEFSIIKFMKKTLADLKTRKSFGDHSDQS